MAERSGFEPEGPVAQANCLAGSCFQPLSHLSEKFPDKGNFEDTKASVKWPDKGHSERSVRTNVVLTKKISKTLKRARRISATTRQGA